jgi:hypothetical protein
MPDASVSFTGNLTDDPELRLTEGGIAPTKGTYRGCIGGEPNHVRTAVLT